MTSAINPAYPAEGDATTASVRANMLAAKNEIEALQTDKQDTLESGTTIKTIAGKNPLGAGNLPITKEDVGLSNVDNTSDANKPVSTAQATAISNAVDMAVNEANTDTAAAIVALKAETDPFPQYQKIPQFISLAASRNSVTGDSGKTIYNSSVTNRVLTIVANTISDPTVLQQENTGTMTLVAGAGVTFIGAALASDKPGSLLSILPTSTANTYIVIKGGL